MELTNKEKLRYTKAIWCHELFSRLGHSKKALKLYFFRKADGDFLRARRREEIGGKYLNLFMSLINKPQNEQDEIYRELVVFANGRNKAI